MISHTKVAKRFFFVLISLSLLLPVTIGVMPARAQSPPREFGWPREITKSGNRLVYYQPQIGDWTNYKSLTAEMAFSLTPAGGQATVGVVSLTAQTDTSIEQRQVLIRDIKATSIRFPSADANMALKLEQTARQLLPLQAVTISLDRLLAGIERSKVVTAPVAVKNDPPKIFYSAKPAILLLVDGKTVQTKIEKTNLEFVVNTNWDLFFDKGKKQYYLLGNKTWLTAKQVEGPWSLATQLPSDLSKLPATENWNDVKAALPLRASGEPVPQVFFSREPAELALFNGQPVYAKIPGTQLLYVTNTDNEVFVHAGENQIYFLASGRWFRTKSPDGPWTYASGDLPPDFLKIPQNSPKAYVLSSVPGTQEAHDAVMLAEIPVTATINRAEAESKVMVNYTGEPQWVTIEGTNGLQYASNTAEKVIKFNNQYYLCYQAVWFISSNPNGPWEVADSIPREIYSIPPSSPVHNVTYVTVSNPTSTTVECSHTSGYVGMFVLGAGVGATIVWGTGYYYPPYYYYGPLYPYPIYRPWPITYGAYAVYNPYTGGYRVGHAAYGPYGAVGSTAWYNPATGRYGRAATAQTWYGGRTVASAYNPYTGGYGATRQGHNPYAQWGSSVAVRGDDWARAGHITTARGTVGGIQSSQGSAVYRSGQQGTVVRTREDMYVGRDGNVYKRDSNGNWSQHENGNWNPIDTPQRPSNRRTATSTSTSTISPGQRTLPATSQPGSTVTRPNTNPEFIRPQSSTMEGLNREAAARQRGANQTLEMQRARQTGASSGRFGGGSGRFGGGRGFGGRRR